jgi:hypothetical protein
MLSDSFKLLFISKMHGFFKLFYQQFNPLNGLIQLNILHLKFNIPSERNQKPINSLLSLCAMLFSVKKN